MFFRIGLLLILLYISLHTTESKVKIFDIGENSRQILIDSIGHGKGKWRRPRNNRNPTEPTLEDEENSATMKSVVSSLIHKFEDPETSSDEGVFYTLDKDKLHTLRQFLQGDDESLDEQEILSALEDLFHPVAVPKQQSSHYANFFKQLAGVFQKEGLVNAAAFLMDSLAPHGNALYFIVAMVTIYVLEILPRHTISILGIVRLEAANKEAGVITQIVRFIMQLIRR